jgi:glutamate/aspartate transport system permease protein
MEGFDYRVIIANFSFFMGGLFTTFQLAIIAISGGLVLGILVGMARLSSRVYVYYPATVFVNLLRSIPLILVIFWFYFLVPIIVGRPLGDFLSASIAFIVFEASYFSEIIRAGIQSIPRGQMQAAYSTGLNYPRTMGYVIVPQAARNMVPSLLTQSVIIFQDTSLAYVIGLKEFLRSGSIVDAREVRSLEIYAFIGAVYFLICFAMSTIAKRWEIRRSALR